MQCFVAFLRGINVGGHIVVKATLEKVFTSLGFANVRVYKQSGNVVFSAPNGAAHELSEKIEDALAVTLGFEVPIFLRTIADLKEIIASEPFRGQNTDNSSFLITFLNTPVKLPFGLPAAIPKSTAQVIGASDTALFSVTHGGGEGALPNPFIEKTLKCKATTRNIHVIKEIVDRFS